MLATCKEGVCKLSWRLSQMLATWGHWRSMLSLDSSLGEHKTQFRSCETTSFFYKTPSVWSLSKNANQSRILTLLGVDSFQIFKKKNELVRILR